MTTSSDSDYLDAAGAALPRESEALLRYLHRFTMRRLAAARECGQALSAMLGTDDRSAAEMALHRFLRDCWEALDGLAREVNLVLYQLSPEARLYPPFEMTRQCTFYVVRKNLHEHPATADHPVSRLLWQRTRERPGEAYRRLSFLYNLSLFFPLRLAEGRRLPGGADLPPAARKIIKPAQVPPADASEGTEGMLGWVEQLVGDCYGLLAEALGSGDDATR